VWHAIWNATVHAAVALAGADDARGHTAREREVNLAVKTVAAYLGNTPAVCRASYVDPKVIDRFHAGVTIASRSGGIAAQDRPLERDSPAFALVRGDAR
jgi:DNA topoisomerase-1